VVLAAAGVCSSGLVPGSAHADLCDLRFQPSQGRLASFGLSRGRRAGRHTGGRVSRSVRHSRFGVWCGRSSVPASHRRPVVGKGGGVHLPRVWDGLSGVALMVCRGLSRQDRPLSWKAWEFERPAAGIVGALVPDYAQPIREVRRAKAQAMMPPRFHRPLSAAA
jgi:hypothetical protein